LPKRRKTLNFLPCPVSEAEPTRHAPAYRCQHRTFLCMCVQIACCCSSRGAPLLCSLSLAWHNISDAYPASFRTCLPQALRVETHLLPHPSFSFLPPPPTHPLALEFALSFRPGAVVIGSVLPTSLPCFYSIYLFSTCINIPNSEFNYL
jgi:hypothetical protein